MTLHFPTIESSIYFLLFFIVPFVVICLCDSCAWEVSSSSLFGFSLFEKKRRGSGGWEGVFSGESRGNNWLPHRVPLFVKVIMGFYDNVSAWNRYVPF